MKTIGVVLKEARIRKKYSIEKVSVETKIRTEFLKAIEAEDWSKLPDYSVVSGFVKSIADFLGIGVDFASAVLRRDYPPRSFQVNPKPDLEDRVKLSWSPRLTFFLGVFLIFLVLGGYLLFQYKKFISPPFLLIREPVEGAMYTANSVNVTGKTDPEATVTVNGQPVLLSNDGSFSTELDVLPGDQKINIKSSSRSGRVTTISRTIQVAEKEK